ncbi:MAG: hypothetical protein EA356_00100 [Geminicoccaceae bacterium]|nr:MAG: hypothetical protein EA356_00100 [Geminicoccaceae bacterium]
MRRAWLGAAAGLWLAATPALGDEVLELLDDARELYLEGELNEAISELEFAIQAIRAQAGGLYAATFPEPPTGWTAGPVETVAGIPGLGGQAMSRSYEGPDGAFVEAELLIDNPMIQMFGAMLQNPALMAMQPDAERVRVHRTNAMLQWPGDGSGELMMLLGGRMLLKLEGQGLGDKDDLVGFLEAWDVATLRQLAGL